MKPVAIGTINTMMNRIKAYLNYKIIISAAFLLLALMIIAGLAHVSTVDETKAQAVASSQSVKKAKAAQSSSTIDWQGSSEKKAYPDVNKYPNMWVKVSIKKQRVYLMNGQKVLYTMYCSTGSKESPTPTGTFYIQSERGDFFYNAESGEGAKNYVSFLNHGECLFHSVPTDQNGNFIESEAKELGKESNSHGCVRLSVTDSKWFYDNIKEGTKVVIK